MSVVLDLLPSAPHELPSGDVQATTLPSFKFLFLDSEKSDTCRSKGELDEFNEDADDEDGSDDDDDSVTVIWFTPRPKHHVLSLEEPDDGFELDAPAPSSDSDSDSDSSSSDSSSSDGSWSDETSSSSPASSITSEDRPPAEREASEMNRDRDDQDESWLDEGECDSSSDGSSISDDDSDGGLLDAVVKHEEQLGSEFVYFEEAQHFNNFETSQSLRDIIHGVRKTSDTYVAAMRIFLKVIDVDEGGDFEKLKVFYAEIQKIAWYAAVEWLEEDPEETRALGRARFALIGQLTRLKLFSNTVVSSIIEELDGELHLEGRMNGLQALVRYAGPRICIEETLCALEKVEEACNERPGDYMMKWMYSKMKKDMLVYGCRNHYIGQYNGRLNREDLIRTLTSQPRKRRGHRA